MSELLDRTLPFHLQLDDSGRVTHVGPSFAKLLPDACGRPLASLLREPAPDLPDGNPSGRLVHRLLFATPEFGLRGEFLPHGDGWLFAAVIDPDTASHVADLGLTVTDFAASDLTIEFSMLKWASESQIAETRTAVERLHKLRDELRHQTLTDSLTGIANRAQFLETMEAALERAEPVDVMMIDLDRFKAINDLHGHHAGDGMLVAVAEQLNALVGESGLAARLGGDEFVILLVGEEQCAGAPGLLERIDALNGRRVSVDEVELTMQLSVGHVRRTDETEPGALIRHADIAMYTARKIGASSIGVFDPAAQRELELRRSIAQDLPQAMADDKIDMYYQPIVRLEDFRIHSYEVLSRWDHPTHGMIPPAVFVAVAESCGLVDEFDRYVVTSAIREAVASLTIHGERPRLSINISALSLTDRIVACLAETLEAENFPAAKLSVEVTETASIHDLERTTRVLSDLDGRGITVALDDFGTGFSSLTYLHQLPIGALKIDRSFVIDLFNSRKALSVVRSIIHVAKSLGLPVIAEGIETIEQAMMLRSLGCNFGQGYYFARPEPIDKVRELQTSKLPIPVGVYSSSLADSTAG